MSDPVRPPITGGVVVRRPSTEPSAGHVVAAVRDELGEAVLQPIFRDAQVKGLKGEGLVAHVLSSLLAMPAWTQNLLAILGAGMVDHVFGKYIGGDPAARSTLRAFAHNTLRAAPLAAFRALADIKEDDAREAALRKQIADLVPAPSTAIPAVPEEAHGTMVIRSRAMPGEAANHVHRMVGAACMCLVFRTAKDRWDNEHKPTLLKDEGKGGKDRGGPRASVKLADAESFPVERLSIKDAQEIGYNECPTCQPYTKAAEAAKPKEAVVDHETHDASGHAPAANTHEPPKPIEGWGEKVGIVGRWLLAAFAAALDDTDLGNEVHTLDPTTWRERARLLAHKYLKDAEGTLKDEFDEKGGFKPLTAAQFAALPSRLSDEEAEGLIRLIFAAGNGHRELPGQVKAWMDRLGIRRAGGDKRTEVAAAEAELRRLQQAPNADFAATRAAEERLAKAREALTEKKPKKPFSWSKAIGISIAAVVLIYVVVTAITLVRL